MKSLECAFEAEILSAVLQSSWPERVSAELRTHIQACAVCSDVVATAHAMNSARKEAHSRAVLPDSGVVWWRAQLRARREAAEAAGRPITAAQIIALACVAGFLGACFGATSNWFQSILNGIASTMSRLKLNALLPSTWAFVAGHEALLLLLVAALFLLPGAVYLVVLRD